MNEPGPRKVSRVLYEVYMEGCRRNRTHSVEELTDYIREITMPFYVEE